LCQFLVWLSLPFSSRPLVHGRVYQDLPAMNISTFLWLSIPFPICLDLVMLDRDAKVNELILFNTRTIDTFLFLPCDWREDVAVVQSAPYPGMSSFPVWWVGFWKCQAPCEQLELKWNWTRPRRPSSSSNPRNEPEACRQSRRDRCVPWFARRRGRIEYGTTTRTRSAIGRGVHNRKRTNEKMTLTYFY
jgi:hypothetical protein